MGLRKKTNYLLKQMAHWGVLKSRGGYDETVWVIGAGRSGTTWLSSLINSNGDYRQLFEPFHPVHVPEMRGTPFHLYLRPEDLSAPLCDFAGQVFSGRYFHRWTERENHRFLYRSLLVKDVFCNLLAAWMTQHFSCLKVILLIRNPFAVALSKQKKQEWHWMTAPSEFLRQEKLCKDHLDPFRDLLERVGEDYIERQILIWSVLHYVPLRQFAPDQLQVVFYEDMVRKPVEQLTKISRYLHPGTEEEVVLSSESFQKLSRVAGGESTLNTGKSPLFSWESELSVGQINRGMEILGRFGLDDLYKGGALPRSGALEKIQRNIILQ